MSAIRLAKVTAVHPEGHSVDLIFLDTGDTVPAVQVATPYGGTNFGTAGVTAPTPSKKNRIYDPTPTDDRDIFAVVAMLNRTPIVLGYLLPQINEMCFTDPNRLIHRHASDVYTSIDDAGNVELFHPSGTYLRIGASSAHEDLTGKDFDGRWKIARNTGAAVHVHLSVANAGAEVASVDIDPSGNVTEQNNGNLTATVGGNAEVDAGGTFKATSQGAMTLSAPSITLDTPTATISGILNVDGTGAAGGNVGTINGSLHVVGGDVTADDISLKDHVHTDPQGGSTGPASG